MLVLQGLSHVPSGRRWKGREEFEGEKFGRKENSLVVYFGWDSQASPVGKDLTEGNFLGREDVLLD